MTEEERPAGRQLQIRQDHYCFGCGRQNPQGLKLTFYADDRDGSVWTEWTPAREQEGFPGIVHGGLVTTVLDEVMGWMISSQQIWAVTGALNVRFRKPVEIDVPVIARAWIAAESGRKIDLRAEMRRQEDQLLLADTTALFVRVPAAQAADWQQRFLG